jgi:PLP dependent protein
VQFCSALKYRMSINITNYSTILSTLQPHGAKLVAVSKTKPKEDVKALYDAGHRDFGENYVQELTEKYEQLPKDIRWHFIGHLQSNKVKYIAPFVHLIHGVDSENLLKEINKQAAKNNRIINCLLQIHIATEDTKFGLNETELQELLQKVQNENSFEHIKICGLMGMASFSNDTTLVAKEFTTLKKLFDKYAAINTQNYWMKILSMGMSSDYTLALQNGSNMVRIGSLLFGERNYTK